MADRKPKRQTKPEYGGGPKRSEKKDLDQARRSATKTPAKHKRRAAATLLLEDPDFPQHVIDHVHRQGAVGEYNVILMVYLTATTRLFPRPLNLCVYGPSSCGKSFVTQRVLEMFPPDEVITATQMTKKYLLNQLEEDSDRFKHRVLFIAEFIDPELGVAFREMATTGRVRNLTVRDNQATEYTAEGPTAFITTTTQKLEDINAEDLSRMSCFPVDDSSTQTEAVIRRIRRKYMPKRKKSKTNPAKSVRRAIPSRVWHQCQIQLGRARNTKINVPFADLIQLPNHDPTVRRAFERILQIVEAVTFVCQFRKGRRFETDSNERRVVYADELDWKYARPLIAVELNHVFGLPSQQVVEFANSVVNLEGTEHTIPELVKKLKTPETTVRRRIKQLPDSWKNRRLVPGRGQAFHINPDSLDVAQGLPTVEDVKEFLNRNGGGLA